MYIAAQIISWYKKNKRDLPWRNTKDPYKIWLSEIILQQTRVEQGLNYYLKFLQTYPTINELAAAPDSRVMKLWQGLGYYSRARNLHFTAKYIVKHFKGIFPEEYKVLKTFKGIGDYTAAAIASFAFNKPQAVVDGNVMRVISRIFGILDPIDKSSTRKEINKIAAELLPHDKPGLFNQAMMEFGAMHCRPANPACEECCIRNNCFAFEKQMVNQIPFKTKKSAAKNRFINYLVISTGGKSKKLIYIQHRTGNDIWRNLYDFPCIETNIQIEPDALILSKQWKSLFKNRNIVITRVSEIFKHKLTHQTIFARFYEVSIKSPLADPSKNIELIERNKLKQYAISRLIEKYLQSV